MRRRTAWRVNNTEIFFPGTEQVKKTKTGEDNGGNTDLKITPWSPANTKRQTNRMSAWSQRRTHTSTGEHANSIQKGPGEMVESNPFLLWGNGSFHFFNLLHTEQLADVITDMYYNSGTMWDQGRSCQLTLCICKQRRNCHCDNFNPLHWGFYILFIYSFIIT